jgi:hypothetical protein
MRVGELISAVSTTIFLLGLELITINPSILSASHATWQKFKALFPVINILCYSPQFSTEMTFAFAFRTVLKLWCTCGHNRRGSEYLRHFHFCLGSSKQITGDRRGAQAPITALNLSKNTSHYETIVIIRNYNISFQRLVSFQVLLGEQTMQATAIRSCSDIYRRMGSPAKLTDGITIH